MLSNSRWNDVPDNPLYTPFRGIVEVTPIPTPALLPGLIGMGIAAIRKRKAEQKETVEV